MKEVIEQDSAKIEAIEAAKSEIALRCKAKLKTRPSLVYQILTDPNSISIFRNMKVSCHWPCNNTRRSSDGLLFDQACTYRKFLEEDKRMGTRKLEVGHQAIARFLWISFTFETSLLVWEDDKNRRIKFMNADDKGVMKRFEGAWDISEFTDSRWRSMRQPSSTTSPLPSPPPPLSFLSLKDSLADVLRNNGLLSPKTESAFHKWSGGRDQSTLAILEQTVQPRSIPPGMKNLIKRLCAKQVTDMLEDLNAEVERREGRASGNKQGLSKVAPAASMGLSQQQPQKALETFLKPLIDQWELQEPLVNIKIRL